jgi:hypothetical protein
MGDDVQNLDQLRERPGARECRPNQGTTFRVDLWPARGFWTISRVRIARSSKVFLLRKAASLSSMLLADIMMKCPPRVSIGEFLGFEKGAREPGGHQTGRIAVTRKVDLNAISTAESLGCSMTIELGGGVMPDFSRASSASLAYRSLIWTRSSSVRSSRLINAF